MTTQTVHGLDELIDCLDRAVQRADAESVTSEV